MREIKTIVIHCSATPNGLPVSIETIRGWHLERGFSDIGYHYVINVNGVISTGRPIERQGEHVKGFNRGTVGVCLVGGTGGKDKLNPGRYTDPQWSSLAKLVKSLAAKYGADIKGHRDFSPDKDGDGEIEPSEWIKLCPCFDVAKWVDSGFVPESSNIL